MTQIKLAPGEVIQIENVGILLIQNLDAYKPIDVSKENTADRWFEVDARQFIKMQGPLFLKNANNKTALDLVCAEI